MVRERQVVMAPRQLPHADLRPTSPLAKHLAGEPALPQRIEQMIALLLMHRDVLCAYDVGTLELHFRHTSVKVKVTCSPEG